MVCDRLGCPACMVLIGTSQSSEWRDSTEAWTSTGGVAEPGVWGTGILAKGTVKEAGIVTERSKRWVCSWDCFDRWAKAAQDERGPPGQGRGRPTLGGITLSRKAAERLRAHEGL